MDRERLKQFLTPRATKKDLIAQNAVLTASVQEMKVVVQEMRLQVIDILSGTMITGADDSGNPYQEKATAVKEIISKYQNAAEWGCQFVQKVINQRKALVIPFGVDVQHSAEFENVQEKPVKEIQYIKDFLEYNGFPQGREDVLCRQSEMEGECLITLHWDEEVEFKKHEGMVRIKRKQWSDLEYTIHVSKDDVDEITKITWKESEKGDQELTSDGDIPYVVAVFNGTTTADGTLQGMPLVAFVLGECENLHKALKGWRKTNRYFANLTPFFQADSKTEADEILARITASGWKHGKAFVGKKMELIGPTAGAEVRDLVYGEIRTNAQIISGTTGIPVHHLGFPDLIGGGRATAQTMMEPLEVVAINDMGVWYGFYKDLFDKVIKMHNEKANMSLREGVVVPKLLPISETQWHRIEKIWMPAARDGLIPKKLFMEQLPNVDVDEVLESQLEEFEKESLRRLTDALDRGASRSSNKPDETGAE